MKKKAPVIVMVIVAVTLVWVGASIFGTRAEINDPIETKTTDSTPSRLVQWQIYVICSDAIVSEVRDISGTVLATPATPTEDITFDFGDTGDEYIIGTINIPTMRSDQFAKLIGGFVVRIVDIEPKSKVIVFVTEQLSGLQLREDLIVDMTEQADKKFAGEIQVTYDEGNFEITGGEKIEEGR